MKKYVILLLLVSYYTRSQVVNLVFENYNTVYAVVDRSPIYSHYVLKYSDLKEKIKRKDFRKCPLVNKSSQAGKSDYKKDTIFDIGHLAPFLDLNQSKKTILETSYYTNTAPQEYTLNRGMWRQLELFIHELCKKNKYNIEVYTYCEYGYRKLVSIKIPTFYYKIIIFEKKIIAFKIPNEKPKNSSFMDFQINSNDIIDRINLLGFDKIEKEKF